MINKKKQKRRLRKSLSRRRKEIAKIRLSMAWRDIFVKAGILKNEK